MAVDSHSLSHHCLQKGSLYLEQLPGQVGEKTTFTGNFHLGQGVIRKERLGKKERENSGFRGEVPGGKSIKQI